MKRPLACAGALYLAVQLIAAFLPPVVFGPLAAVLFMAAVPAGLFGGKRRARLLLLCLVPACAFTVRMAAQYFWIAPIQSRAGQEAEVQAVVMEANSSYIDGCVRATVLVDAVDGEAVRPFRVYCGALPEAAVGERFTARMRFSLPQSDQYLASRYADGCFLSAECPGGISIEGESGALWARAARVRMALSGQLLRCMEQPYAGMAAAMTVGERSALKSEAKDALRMAGLSHIVVVSGMHLSAVSGLVYAALRRVCQRRAASVLAIAATAGFMLLAGWTPSVTRAGIAMILLYSGALFGRKSDGLTSLGAAALLLCLHNPYAAVDVGFLLSCLATLGVLIAVDGKRRYDRAHGKGEKKNVLRRLTANVFWAAVTSAAATLATLPVLIATGSGVSLLTVLCSLLVLPVLPVVIGLGFAAALCGFVPWLAVAQRLAAALCGRLLRWILGVAQWAADVPNAFIYISGAFAMCVSVLICLLIGAAWHWRVPVRTACVGVLCFVVFCAVGYAAFDEGVVRVELAGSGANPSVIVMEGMRTVVIYRGTAQSVNSVRAALRKYNRTDVDFLIDLREDGDTQALAEALSAKESVHAASRVNNHAIYAPFGDVLLYVRRQAKGILVCVEVRGMRIGVARGSVDFSYLPPLDCYIAGSSQPQALACDALIVPRPQSCDWVTEEMYTRLYGRAGITVRAGRSLTVREENNAFDWGFD